MRKKKGDGRTIRPPPGQFLGVVTVNSSNDQPFASLYSVAQPSTNAVTTASQLPVPAA